MRSDDELRAFFRDELQPHLAKWESLPRVSALNAVDIVVGIAGLAAWLAFDRRDALWLLVGFAVLRVVRDQARIRRAFKHDVLRRLFEFVLPGIQYEPDARLPAQDVRRSSGLFPESWNRDSGEDRVAGRLGATEFRFSELRLVRKRGKQSDVVFAGLFFTADFHKSFRGRTFLLPDRAERLFGSLGRAVQALPRFDGTELVELEDPDFEKRFVCHATDAMEARYILSPSLMRRILELAEQASGSPRISFVDESLCLALPLAGDLFPVPAGRGRVDEARILAWARELLSVVGIVEELGLNTRIWSKSPAAG